MPRKSQLDKGRRFFETSSPFETGEPSGKRPTSFSGVTDRSPAREFGQFLSGEAIFGAMQPDQYDNPRGFGGLGMVTAGEQKSKLGSLKAEHSIQNHTEGGAKLARTGK